MITPEDAERLVYIQATHEDREARQMANALLVMYIDQHPPAVRSAVIAWLDQLVTNITSVQTERK